jgi:hypothetical protein
VDPMIDRERSKVIDDLTFDGCVDRVQLAPRPNIVVPPSVALTTDGDLAIVTLQRCESAHENEGAPPLHHRTIGGRFVSRLILEGRHAVLRGNVYYWSYRAVRELVVVATNSVEKNSYRYSLRRTSSLGLDH